MKYFTNRSLNSDKRYYLYFFIAVVLFLSNPAFSQNYFFKHYDINDGLAQSQITTIYQDSQRYLWLGTFGGLSRFNGVDFVNYTKTDGLTDDFVTSICQGKDEMLLGTHEGISSIKNGQIKTVFRNSDANMMEINDFVKDEGGVIWFINHSHLNNIFKTKIQKDLITSSSDERILALSQNKQGKIFAIVYGEGVYCKTRNNWVNVVPFKGDFKTKEFTKLIFDKTNPDKIYLLSSKMLYVAQNASITSYQNAILDSTNDILLSVAQDKNGILWLGTGKGAYCLRDKDPIRFTADNGFTNDVVNNVYEDPQGNLWLGTDGDGFYKFQGFDVTGINKINNTPFQLFMAIGIDDSNNVWMGTDGQGLLKFNKNKLENIILPSADPYSRYITSIGYKKGLPLLVNAYDGLWELDHEKFNLLEKRYVLPKHINKAIYDHSNTIWMATTQGCCYLKKNDNPYFIKNIKGTQETIVEIGNDSILVAGNQGLALIRDTLVDTNFKFNEFSSTNIMCLFRYKNLVIGGTMGEGLFSIDLTKKTIRKYTMQDGLRSNAIYSLVDDQYGTIWAGTGKGIDKFTIDPKTQSIQLINDIVDNPIVEFDQNAILNYDSKIWVGGAKGLFIYDIQPFVNNEQPVINIESVKISNQENSQNKNDSIYNNPIIPDSLNFKYGNKHITITFRGIFYSDPESIQYQYRLKGFDEQFSSASKLNRVDYTGLPPGNYEFEVRAIASNGLVSAIRAIPIVVTPAFYQTSFFYVLIVILFISLLILIQWLLDQKKIRQRMIMESIKHEEQTRIRRQTAEDFHDDIGNKLTRIVILSDILEHKGIKHDKELNSLINQIRENTSNLYSGAKDILWALDPQSDDLDAVLLQVKNFAIDLFNNTETSLQFEGFEVTYNKHLPIEFSRNINMIFKELLNNIFKHANASKVILSVRCNQNKVEITVLDNGKGFQLSTQKKGNGLVNIKVRAERIKGDIDINSETGVGTKITLRFDLLS